jgi:hypothetical protein
MHFLGRPHRNAHAMTGKSLRAWPFAITFGAALLLADSVPALTVRMFAVGHKQRLVDAVTYQAYHDKMLALVDGSFPGRATLVQSGVDDVASHVQPADPAAPPLALVNFPEDVGLLAGLIGSRAAIARSQTNSALAIDELAAAYAPLVAHYNGVFGPTHPVRDVFIAATDTLYRSFYETFREVAMTYGVYVTASANVAPARRVEEADDPALVALLRDPDEPGRTYAYEAISPLVRNCVFIFDPDGEVLVPQPDGSTLRSPSETGGAILPSITKAYLTPLEILLLGLVVTPVRDMDVVATPVGRIGVVISKDAWMTDVNDRFEAKNAQILLQSEAFSEWGFETAEWWPDIFKEGGFSFLQKNPSFVVNIDPSMTGNLFDITFDGQSTILGKKTKTGPGPLSAANAWVGQNPDTGFLSVAPWVIDDPGIASPSLSLAARRTQLAATGVALLPTSTVLCADDLQVGACRNGYREAIIHTDVELPDGPRVLVPPDPGPRVPTAFGTNLRVHPPDSPSPALQKNARVAASRRKVGVVWQDDRHGLPTIYLAASTDGGVTFAPPVKVSDNAPGAVAELYPDIAILSGKVRVVWQELEAGSDDDRGRIKLARLNLRGRKYGADARVDDPTDDSGAWRPALAAVSRYVYVTWIDERDVAPASGFPFEHVFLARSRDGGRSFDPPQRVDAGAPLLLASSLNNKWAPAIAAYRRGVTIAWADFRNYNWDIFSASSADRGVTFGPNVRVDDFVPATERLHQNPAVAVVPDSERVIVAWTDLRAREADSNILFATSTDAGATFSANAQLDASRTGFDPDTDTPSNQWTPSLAAHRDDVCAAWQDNRLGDNDIFFTASGDGGATFAADERVDDTGAGPSNQYNPDVAIARTQGTTRCYVVWEDTRDGDSDIYLASRVLP